MKYMKQAKSVDLKNQTKRIIILASILFVLIAAAIIIKVVVDNYEFENPSDFEPPELLEGEAYANGYYRVAYPQIEADKMDYIRISTPDGEYGLMRNDKGELYVLYTPEGDDELTIYYPPVVDSAGTFDYTSLFQVADEYGITNVFYLCSVLGTLYFDERIALPTDENEKNDTFRYYGFTEENVRRVSFNYIDEDGETQTHSIAVGDKILTGRGYYYMVDNRPYIYATTSGYFDYAFAGAASLINSTLIAEGLEKDSYFEPYLTPEYKQWVATLHDNATDAVVQGSTVIVTAEILSPQNPSPSANPNSFIAGGYEGAGFGKTEFDLSTYTDEKFTSLVSALVGKTVGSYAGNEIVFSIVNSGLVANIPDGSDDVTYDYTVTAIEAILLDSGDVSTVGTAVGANKLLKVTYTASVAGKTVTPAAYHAVIDLNSDLIPTAAKEAFAAAQIGTLSTPIQFSSTYSKNDADNQVVSQLVITEIHEIYNAGGVQIDTVAANSLVTYSYVVKIDGEVVSDIYMGYVDLAKNDTPNIQFLRDLFVGKTVAKDLNLVAETYIEYPQVMYDFNTVTVKEIHGFVTNELVVSFRFVNEDKRDPFYGESIYENTLDNSDRNYALNDSICQSVLDVLGGIGENATSSNGYAGLETVAIGLNTETMIQYGFYKDGAYKIKFVLPRNISETGGEDELDYEWTTTLPFTLYVSAENEDGTRYAASDMYDTVVKVDADDFVFLKYNFIDFWARRTPMLLNVENISSLKLDLNMPNIYGSYKFDMSYTDYYYDSNGNRYREYASGRIHDLFMEIAVTQGAGSMETALSKYITDNGIVGPVDFSRFYGNGTDNYIELDTEDVSYFKEVMLILYMTNYVDTLTAAEQSAAMTHDPIMTIELALKKSTDKYVYEFRRFEDRRVMVTIKCCAPDGTVRHESSDFYISSAITREIITGFVYLLNGKPVDSDIFYEDLPLYE